MFAFRSRRDGRTLPHTLLLAALLLDFVIAATLYNALIPVFEQPDETGHYFYAQHLAQTGELPLQVQDVDARGPWEQEGSQPPLYYYLTAPLVTLAGGDLDAEDLWYNHQNSMGNPEIDGNDNRFVHDPAREGWPWKGYALAVHLGRGLSTLLGLVTLWCLWGLARRVFPGRRWLALACVALVGFNPQFLTLSAAFSNDNAIVLLSAASLLLLSRLADGRDPGRTVPLLAVCVGLAPLAKLSGLALLGFTLLTLGWLAWRRRDPRWLLTTALPVLFAAALLSGWWYARNLRLYDSLTGLNFMLPERMGRSWRLDRWLREEAWGELVGIWWSSWGLFGWFTVLLPRWIYHLISLLSGLSLVGLGLAWRERRRGASGWLDPFGWIDWPRLGWLLLWAGIVLASLLRWLTISKGGQGRLLFPALAALAVVLIGGWRRLFARPLEALGRRGMPVYAEEAEDPEAATILNAERGDATLAGLVIAIMYAFAAWALLFVIRPAYAGPRTIDPSDIPESATPVGLVFGEGLRLVAAEVPERVTEDRDFPVTLYWQADRRLEHDAYVSLRTEYAVDDGDLVRRSGPDAVLSFPGRGTLPPSLMRSGSAVYVDPRRVRAPSLSDPVIGEASLLPAEWLPMPAGGRLRVSVYDPESATAWDIAQPEGAESAFDTEWAADLALEPLEPRRRAAPDRPALAVFGPGLKVWVDEVRMPELRDGELPVPSDRIGIPSGTALVWQAEGAPGEDLQVFLHLLDAEGTFLGAFDQPLQTATRYRSGSWLAGETLPTELAWNLWNQIPRPPLDSGSGDPSPAATGSDGAQTPEGLPAAAAGSRYALRFGLYRLADGSRIPAFDAEGRRYPDDAVPLHAIEIVEPDGR